MVKLMKKENKIANLRVFAILTVVLGHSIILYSNSWDLYTTIYNSSFLNNLKKIVNFYEMPLFFSLAGYLFYYTCLKKRKITNFVKDKFSRLIIPFAFVSLLWVIPLKMILEVPGFTILNYFELAFKNVLLLSSTGHLWFLITLFLIFLIYFIIDKIFDLTKTNTRGKIVDISIVFITLLIVLNYTFFKEIIFQTAFLRVFAYLFWFYLGFLLCKYFALGKNENTHKMWWVSYLALFTGALIIYKLDHSGIIINFLVKLTPVILFYLIIPPKTNKFIQYLERNSLGMYLFHSPLIYISFTYFPNINPYFMVFINFVCFGLLASVITEIIRKSGLKFLIGEK